MTSTDRATEIIAAALDTLPATDLRPTTLVNRDRAALALKALAAAGYTVSPPVPHSEPGS